MTGAADPWSLPAARAPGRAVRGVPARPPVTCCRTGRLVEADWQLAARYWFFWHLPAVSPEQDANRHAALDEVDRISSSSSAARSATIGAELFRSCTVEWHLRKLYAKLGSTSRARTSPSADLTRALRYPTAEDKAEMYAGLNPQLTCNQAERTGGTSRSGSHMYEWVVSVSTHATTELRELLVPGGREWWSPGLLFFVCGRGGIA